MSFEVVSVDKCYAIEAEAKGDILETQMVEGEILYTFAAFPGSPFNDAMYQVRAKKVFRLWLDVLAELPMGQTLTLWSVVLLECVLQNGLLCFYQAWYNRLTLPVLLRYHE